MPNVTIEQLEQAAEAAACDRTLSTAVACSSTTMSSGPEIVLIQISMELSGRDDMVGTATSDVADVGREVATALASHGSVSVDQSTVQSIGVQMEVATLGTDR